MSADMMTDDIGRDPDDEDAESSSSRTGVRLPRVHLANVVALLEKAYEHGRSPSVTQVASAVDQQLNSGAFRNRMAAAAHFGLLTPTRGRVQITDLGMRVLDADQRPAALVDAWMQVPVFKSLYDRFDGNRLPPSSGIEAELKDLGVPSKNVVVIRRVLMTSAETAGLLNPARDRLVRPTISAAPAMQEPTVANPGDAQRQPHSTDIHPMELDFGKAGQIDLNVDIDWLALKQEVFVELRATVEKLKKLAALQRQPGDEAQSEETPISVSRDINGS
jgi:hypothetical protein